VKAVARTHLCANFSALAGASGTVGSLSERCLQIQQDEERVSENGHMGSWDGDGSELRIGALLEGGDGFEEEVNPLDLDGGGLSRVVGGEAVGNGAGAVRVLHRPLQQRERHRRRRALHAPLLRQTRRLFFEGSGKGWRGFLAADVEEVF
jgi:hypothetical protein